jgi:PKD repeat protein
MCETYIYKGSKLHRYIIKSLDESFESTTDYSYVNIDHLCIKEIHCNNGEINISENIYDSKKRIKQRNIFSSNKLCKRISYQYDDNDNIIEEYTLDIKNEFDGIAVFRYDHRGNWIEKTMYKNNIPFKRVTREITYI